KFADCVVTVTACDWPGASVTEGAPSAATSPAGPASERSKVSVAVPVFLTVARKVSPGAPADLLRLTATPALATMSVPAAELEAADVVEAAATVKGSLPAAAPRAGVRVSVTSRKLLAPGGTVIEVGAKTAATFTGRPI